MACVNKLMKDEWARKAKHPGIFLKRLKSVRKRVSPIRLHFSIVVDVYFFLTLTAWWA